MSKMDGFISNQDQKDNWPTLQSLRIHLTPTLGLGLGLGLALGLGLVLGLGLW